MNERETDAKKTPLTERKKARDQWHRSNRIKRTKRVTVNCPLFFRGETEGGKDDVQS